MRLGDVAEIVEWVKGKLGELQSFVQSGKRLVNTALPKAVGAPGEPGNIEEIVYVGKRLAEVYRCILEWTAEFRLTQVEDKFSRLLEIIARASRNVIEEIEAFAVDLYQQLNDAVRRYETTKQPQSLKITITPTCPDMSDLESELRLLSSQL